MGRLKAWHHLNPLFSSTKYKKLLDDYGHNDYSRLLLQESLQEYLSYACGHCGHVQKLKAEELNSIVGHAFRLAYAAHLQKASPALRDVINTHTPTHHLHTPTHHAHHHSTHNALTHTHHTHTAPTHTHATTQHPHIHHHSSSSSSTSSSSSSRTLGPTHSTTPPPSALPHILIPSKHAHAHPHALSHAHLISQASSAQEKNQAASCAQNTPISSRDHSPQPCSSSTSCCPSSSAAAMRTPGSPAQPQGGGAGGGTGHVGVMRGIKPVTLPGLEQGGGGPGDLHTPDSDTSNSPTELNCSRRLGDKPPLIKKLSVTLENALGLEEDLHALVTTSTSSSSSSSSSTTTTTATLPSTHTPTSSSSSSSCVTSSSTSSSSGSTSSSTTTTTSLGGGSSVVGYVNERGDDTSANGQETLDVESKCRLAVDDIKFKRISQISVSSSTSSGVVGGPLDVSTTSSTRSCTPPPLPERSDSLTPPEEPHLRTAAWFQAGIPREIALEVLSQEPVGAFMVRESTSKPGCYALSLRVPRDFAVSGIAHYLIVKTNKGYKIKGFTKEFCTLTALITHHSVMPELLPCPLSLSRYNPTFTTDDHNQRNADANDDDPDYNTLSDFRKMMADLNV